MVTNKVHFSDRPSVVLLSAGVDSTTLMYAANKFGTLAGVVVCDYGQPAARKEVELASKIICEWPLKHEKKIKSHIAVLPVPSDEMRIGVGQLGPRVLPGRNLALIATAISWACKWKAGEVLLGATADDYGDYPDCREAWISHLSGVSIAAYGISVSAPFSGLTKREIVTLGRELDVPLSSTWSCYEPTDNGKQCGKCNSCLARRLAGL